MKYLSIAIMFFISYTTSAEVYRWTDANGKVHYTDKKPSTNAEDITAQVKKQNIDTSTEERKKVGAILRKENDADREFYQQQQAQEQQKLNEKIKRCNASRKYLRDISGPVQFIDDQGKPIQVTEQERQRRAIQLEATIKKECP